MYKIYRLIFFLFFFFNITKSQTIIQVVDTLEGIPLKSRFIYIGATGGVNHFWNETQLPIIPGGLDCGLFSKGTDFGFYFGFEGEYEIIPKSIYLNLKILFDRRPVTLTQTTSSYEVYDDITKAYVPLLRGHYFDGYLDYLIIEGGGAYRLPINFPIYMKITADAGNPIFGTQFENSEEILRPESILFPDMTRKRTIEKGLITNAGTSYGVSLGIGTELELKNGFFLKPEIRFRYALNSVMSDYDWHTNILRVGLNISRKFDIGEKQKIIKIKKIILPEPKKPNPPQEIVKPEIVKEFSSEPVKILETVVTQTYPLLNYVFFDSASTEIMKKYLSKNDINSFSEETLPKETLSIYYNLFDILGKRMIDNQDSKIILTGVTDGEELPNQKDRLKIAESRARKIADYLIYHWNIPEKRIIIESQDFPKLPTSKDYLEGYQENRRVEITSDNPAILKPVIHSKFFEYTSTQEQISFKLNLNPEIEILGWNFTAFDGLINSQNKPDKIDKNIEISFPLTKQIIDYIGTKIELGQPIRAKISLNTLDGSIEEKEININITKELNKFEIGRLNLIVFDFDKFEISKMNQKMINDFIKSSIQDNSTVEITGSTDRLGELKYNYKLSSDRAVSVRNYIQTMNPSAKIANVMGIGPSILPYDNNLPEGRFYCRTVLIEVKTPLK